MSVKHTLLVRGAAVLLLALPALAAGCAKPTAVVSGKVTYRGKALTIGTVRFLTSDHKVLAGEIGADGSYSVSHVPAGETKISVSVPSPSSLLPPQKGVNGKATDNPPDKPPASIPKVVRVPDEYANTETSGLTYTVTTEATQTHDIPLK